LKHPSAAGQVTIHQRLVTGKAAGEHSVEAAKMKMLPAMILAMVVAILAVPGLIHAQDSIAIRGVNQAAGRQANTLALKAADGSAAARVVAQLAPGYRYWPYYGPYYDTYPYYDPYMNYDPYYGPYFYLFFG
jgi:hypothetical protein